MIFGSILDSHLESFSNSVQKVGKSIVDGTLAIHREMASRFLPSAVKFHYNFNMRDLAAVFQGLCSIHHSHVRDGLKVARLWMHECERVYADRLISNTEIQRCIEIIVDVAKRVIDDDQESLFKQPNAWTTFATQTMDDSRAYAPGVLSSSYAIDATRVHQRRRWVVSFPISGPFGPSRDTAIAQVPPDQVHGFVEESLA